ncbi:MAG: hypothetical protein QXY96_07425 [Candidatus Methanomethylicaceae archaeon]
MNAKLIKTKYKTKCLSCNKNIVKDENVVWIKGEGVYHLSCYEKEMEKKKTAKTFFQGKCEICNSERMVVYHITLSNTTKPMNICENCIKDIYNFAKSLW